MTCPLLGIRRVSAVRLPREDLDGEDKNPTDLDVIETVCYSTSLDIPLRDSFNGVRSTADVNRVFTYFGSWNGVMKIFPGGSYDRECGEYDPRVRPWYVTASSGPKDVVILMDSSNSMRNGDYFDLAKSAVIAVLNTMNEQTFVNVVTFSDKVSLTSWLHPTICVHLRDLPCIFPDIRVERLDSEQNRSPNIFTKLTTPSDIISQLFNQRLQSFLPAW